MPDDPNIQAGTDIPQPQVGKVADWLFNQSNFLRQVVAAAVSWLNLSVIVKLNKADGTTQSMPVVKPVITGKNAILTLPIDVTSLGGSGSATVYDGAGVPSATTLAAGINYVKDNLYVDTTAQNLYYCTTAGTNTTSVWVKIAMTVFNPRGVFVLGQTYSMFDFVVVQSGPAQGSYYSILDLNMNDPATGIGWLQFAPGQIVGQWQ